MSGAEEEDETAATLASRLAIVAAEVSVTTGVSYAEALDMLMRAAGYVPVDEPAASVSVHKAAVQAVLELCDAADAAEDWMVVTRRIRAAITGAGVTP